MKSKQLCYLIVLSAIILTGWKTITGNWISETQQGYKLFYTSADAENKNEYIQLIESGINSVAVFFNSDYHYEFDIFIHPDRHSLDSTWQTDWQMPDFNSECWMVASGTASRVDMISPKRWEQEACEHHYEELNKTRQLITHELFHVYHGQLNVSPDFSNVEGIDWFIEGLATYASGQCDSNRIAEIKKAIAENKIPESLNAFWTGKLKYGLSGSVVMYIDEQYGRIKLKELLSFNKKSEILNALQITETELLSAWRNYLLKR